jgi:hypothetical protein
MMNLSTPITSVLGNFQSVSLTSPAMYQLNPGGLETIDNQNNAQLESALGPDALLQDSQFRFDLSGEVEDGHAESSTFLRAATGGLDPPVAPAAFDFAQIVVPVGATITWRIQIAQGLTPLQTETGTFVVVIPEASQIIVGIVGTMAILGIHIVRRRHKWNIRVCEEQLVRPSI